VWIIGKNGGWIKSKKASNKKEEEYGRIFFKNKFFSL
jgi:hypothetical protein